MLLFYITFPAPLIVVILSLYCPLVRSIECRLNITIINGAGTGILNNNTKNSNVQLNDISKKYVFSQILLLVSFIVFT